MSGAVEHRKDNGATLTLSNTTSPDLTMAPLQAAGPEPTPTSRRDFMEAQGMDVPIRRTSISNTRMQGTTKKCEPWGAAKRYHSSSWRRSNNRE